MGRARQVFKIVTLGELGVGKTSLIHRICHDKWVAGSAATIGADFACKEYSRNANDGSQTSITYMAQFWDTAGQEQYLSVQSAYYRRADACLLTFSVDDPEGFSKMAEWYTEIRRHLPRTPIVVLGNKADLVEQGQQQEVSTWIESLTDPNVLHYFEVSAKTGSGLPEMELYLIDKLSVMTPAGLDGATAENVRLQPVQPRKRERGLCGDGC
eukprot:TRINITY_DN59399_c0_g3_i1.p1 TRINITY_DN59399_c0_g3~~TRINITY_DN59399_c0_g3_i1.p1  ORF type:complete len:212 (-),score=19.05 TRINITY_DN59399_c0_g3_i1:256-891(-)